MTDEELDQILRQALSPEVDNSEISIRRKDNNMKIKKIIAGGIVACAALALVVNGINYTNEMKTDSNSIVINNNDGVNPRTDNNVASSEKDAPINMHFSFAITAYAAELPEDFSSGDVINIRVDNSSTGSSLYLSGRFFISGDNIEKIKITTDKCNLYSVCTISKEDFDENEENSETEQYAIAQHFDPITNRITHDYEHMVIEGNCYEGNYDKNLSFGMSVPKTLWSTKYDLQEAHHEDVDQVNGATLTIEVTFVDGSTETHHYKLVTGKIFVPCDDDGYLEWDNLTRFVSSEDEPYTYGYLLEKID